MVVAIAGGVGGIGRRLAHLLVSNGDSVRSLIRRPEQAESVGRSEIPRDDVAATLLTVLHEPGTAGLTFELVAGDTPITEALARLAA